MACQVAKKEGGSGRLAASARRAQLVEVGRTVFAQRGYEATSVEEIAARAGISKPIVLRALRRQGRAVRGDRRPRGGAHRRPHRRGDLVGLTA